MDERLQVAVDQLNEIQREAVEWRDGPMLLLAGPGSGKTQVLTVRIALLLHRSRDKGFRILALTFTNKAADEMATRVKELVPGLELRVYAGTFHSFCAQILRQHGIHAGISPEFRIYSQDDDRRELLRDALSRAIAKGISVSETDIGHLPLIDKLKSRLIGLQDAGRALARVGAAPRVESVYRIYEVALREANALDFNSLVLETVQLAKTFPPLAATIRRTYPYWLVDEFQDTTPAQYALLKTLANDSFRNLFAVADDDQIIYEWNGASYQQLEHLRKDFTPVQLQLSTNHRCPPSIVRAANLLIAHNTRRTPEKRDLVAGKRILKLPEFEHMLWSAYEEDAAEASGTARAIAGRAAGTWGNTAILARNRALLERVLAALEAANVPAVIAQRRDAFLSPHFVWLHACLRQAARPLDRRNVQLLAAAFHRMAGVEPNEAAGTEGLIVAAAETSGRGLLTEWSLSIAESEFDDRIRSLVIEAQRLAAAPSAYRQFVESSFATLEVMAQGDPSLVDLDDDLRAWRELRVEIARDIGKDAPIDQFLQALDMRSKEPPPRLGAVSLMTIHAAKGRQFEFVHLLGLAEEVLPSWQAVKQGDASREMEEERRNCFVAITRTQESLALSWAARYRGWPKAPSRFLAEMGILPS